MHNRNLVFFYFRSSLRAREHDAERVQDAKTASKPATKVKLCKINYAELCRIMRSYAFSGIMRNFAFSGRIMHLHNRLSPGNKQLTLGE